MFWNRFLQPFFSVCIQGYCKPSSGRNTVSIVLFEYPVWVPLSRGCILGLLVYLARPLTPTRTPKPQPPFSSHTPIMGYVASVANPSPRLLVWGFPLPPPPTHVHVYVLMCVCTGVCPSARRREIDEKRKIGWPVT